MARLILRTILTILSLILLGVVLTFTYNFPREGANVTLSAFLFWLFLTVGLFVVFSIAIWFLVRADLELFRRPTSEAKILKKDKEIHLSKYNGVYQEINRYRDLSWKIAILSWAVYLGLHSFFWNGSEPITELLQQIFFIMLFLASISATVFLVFCEVSTNANKQWRRRIENKLDLQEEFQFTERGENPIRLGFLFSMSTFLLAIWLPPLVILFVKRVLV